MKKYQVMNQYQAMRETLPEFVKGMKETIERATERYGDFTDYKLGDLMDHYREEVEELKEAVDKLLDPIMSVSPMLVMQEAIDVANMAYMIWWFASLEEKNESLLRANKS